MANRYVRSLFWLCSFTGLGYTLLTVASSKSDKTTSKLKKDLPAIERNPREVINKNQQFVNVLQAASQNNKPFYRLSKSEIEKELK